MRATGTTAAVNPNADSVRIRVRVRVRVRGDELLPGQAERPSIAYDPSLLLIGKLLIVE